MEFDRYREAVAANRRKHGFDVVDGGDDDFDRIWSANEDDPTVGSVSLFATVVNANDADPEDVIATADRFREVLADLTDGTSAATPIGYVVFAVDSAHDDLVSAATSYTVAERRSNVFPLVYDLESETLHTHPVPRLKGRGIYQRQSEDAERFFDV
ncbi:hypothetical protein DQW50_11800 [Halorubrum sp. 48-1-W]|uniref:hypothetical protein n=1 Tax=Halorubrum sp. 48-1-W TaxID=2249761 RepID=UPI000DCD10CD|nr:hypothetical protein [Halorubrum sp. 48-1-W]RAW44846.1 hypothetical protein DQW50_11800 [Halorubrum sp. 48-1-W]